MLDRRRVRAFPYVQDRDTFFATVAIGVRERALQMGANSVTFTFDPTDVTKVTIFEIWPSGSSYDTFLQTALGPSIPAMVPFLTTPLNPAIHNKRYKIVE